jgi:CYTH domain-containing protein
MAEQSRAQEVERKFLVRRIPSQIGEATCQDIIQGYLTSESVGTEVRLRRKGDRWYQTVKSAGALVRAEYEIEITPAQFDRLWPATEGRRIEKTRYELDYGDVVIELDVYRGQLDGLVTAEVEFRDVEHSRTFQPPAWLGVEITEDPRYKNKNLALFAVPKPRDSESEHA